MKTLAQILLAFALASCAGPLAPATQVQEVTMALSITSQAFLQGQPIPADYSCDGRGHSPSLAWTGAPAGTRSFALIMDDPDAPMGTFVHWVIYDIPASSAGLAESVPGDAALSDGSVQGPNSAGRTGYTGPCPPGGTHRYFFKVYALDQTVGRPGLGKNQLLEAMQSHILAEGELMGTYSRK